MYSVKPTNANRFLSGSSIFFYCFFSLRESGPVGWAEFTFKNELKPPRSAAYKNVGTAAKEHGQPITKLIIQAVTSLKFIYKYMLARDPLFFKVLYHFSLKLALAGLLS